MFEILVCFSLAYFMGLLFQQCGLPSLLGYLSSGFLILAFPSWYVLPSNAVSAINELAHVGVLLLLFAVGLKLDIKQLVKPEIVGPGVLHFVLSSLLYVPALWVLLNGQVSLQTIMMLSIALSFSSTVLAAKTLEVKAELKSFHGRIVIGILIVQDLIAMTFMSVSSGVSPSPWAMVVFLLPLLRPLLFKLISMSGHDDLLLMAGAIVAVGVGGYGFHAVGLSGELGALIMGAMLASHSKATELSARLWSLKELFLVAFFLSIGLKGLPDYGDLIFAVAMLLLLPIQAVVFYVSLAGFKLGARSAFLGAISLTNYSEFGLIVAAVVLPEWTVPLALAVALSFLVSAPLNRYAHPLFDRCEGVLSRFQRSLRHPDEEPCDLGDANVLIMGTGRVGRAAYGALSQHSSFTLVALDSDKEKVAQYDRDGMNCFYADAEHATFWANLDLDNVHTVVLAMNCSDAAVSAAESLRKSGYTGYIVAHTLFDDDVSRLLSAGADEAYLTMNEAGEGLANHVVSKMRQLNASKSVADVQLSA